MHLTRTASAIAATLVSLAGPAAAQGAAAVSAAAQQQGAALPPATKLEAFKPSAGSVLTKGFTNVGNLKGVSVSARDLHDSKGVSARGLVVQVHQSEYREERSFVDVDEIPELLRGIDALLAVKANPTPFANFEATYETRGAVKVTAYNYEGEIQYAIEAGRTLVAQKLGLGAADIVQFRDLVAKAQSTLAATAAK